MRELEKWAGATRVASIAIALLTVVTMARLATGDERRRNQAPVIAPSGVAFEVATIRPNTSGSRARSLAYPPDRFVATNMPLRFLIGNAYGDTFPVRQDMILGGPSWIASEGYDVEAKVTTSPDGGTLSSVMARKLMLRTLLAERFTLKMHAETRDLPLYALSVANADGKIGPQLRPSTGADCVSAAPSRDAASNLPSCGPAIRAAGEAGAYFVSMAEIAKTVGQFLDRPVIDQTRLSGRFTFEMHFTPPPETTSRPGMPPEPQDPDAVSIFTAAREQLGLKLESTRGPLEVLVIDGAERPTTN